MYKKTKKQQKAEDFIYGLDDFPVFNYWNFNKKQFVPRPLNRMSSDFVYSLAIATLNIPEERLKEYLANEIVYATKYAYFGNASYEAEGPNSCGGGDNSIQEQFVCWATGITVKQYRNREWQYNNLIGQPLLNWVEGSKLYKKLHKNRPQKVRPN